MMKTFKQYASYNYTKPKLKIIKYLQNNFTIRHLCKLFIGAVYEINLVIAYENVMIALVKFKIFT